MKISKYFILVFLITCSLSSYSQSLSVEWEKDFYINKKSCFTDIIEDINGGYTLLGTTDKTKNGTPDIWLSRINNSGDTIWNSFIAVSNPMNPECLVQLSDSSYIIAGTLDTKQIAIIKTDNNGQEVWNKNIGEENFCSGGEIISISNGEFLLAGSKAKENEENELLIMKIDSQGEIIWKKTFNEEELITGRSIKLLPDGGFAIASQVVKKGMNNSDIWILRIDENGEEIWSSRVPSNEAKAWPECICCSPDNNLMVVGWHGTAFNDINSENPIMDYNLWVGKFNQGGELMWSKNIDSEGSEGGDKIIVRPDGNFLIAGKKETSFTGKVGHWLILLNNDGEILHEHLIRNHYHNDKAAKIINTPDEGFIVIGPGYQSDKNVQSFAWIMKYKATEE